MRARSIWLTCAVAWAIASSVAHAQSLSFAPATYTTTSGARGAVSVDINRDGWPDIATANTGRNTIAILLNRGRPGGFHAPRELAVSTGPFDIAAGDFDRDGVPDLVVACPDGPGIDVLLMRGDATLKRRMTVSTSESRGITVVDWTRDGAPDIVYSDYGRRRVAMIPNNGSGSFGPELWWTIGSTPQGVAAADFNHDGYIDIAVANTTGTNLTVLHGNATTSVSQRGYAVGRSHNVLAVADINADGWLDLAAASTATNVVSFLSGGSTGFSLAGTRGTGSSPRGIAAGDFNQDGRPDFAVSNRGSSSVTVLLARAGSMVPARWGDLPAGSGARGTAVADFDNDGRADIAAAPELGTALTLLANDTAFVTPARSFSRLQLEQIGFSGEEIRVADFNENGIPDTVRGHRVLLDGTTTVTIGAVFSGDIVAGDYNRDGHEDLLSDQPDGVEVWLGNGRGEFSHASTIGELAGAHNLALADMDRDGRLDVVATGGTTEGSFLYVARQTSGAHVVTATPLPGFAVDFEIADMNRDAILDVVSAHLSLRLISIRFGDGSGGFANRRDLSTPTDAWRFDIGDLNHDARPDIVAAAEHSYTVILATASGSWGTPVQFPATFFPGESGLTIDAILADLDRDGHLDAFGSGASVLLGNGDGSFGPPGEFNSDELSGAAFVDWNRDGLLDIAGVEAVLINERRAENRPPVADAGPDRTFTYQAQFAQDDGTLNLGPSFDPDFHRLQAEWRDETGAVFARGDWVDIPVKLPGTYTYSLTVRDGRGGEDTDEFRVTILPEEEIVIYSHQDFLVQEPWREVEDRTAADGRRIFYPDAGAPKVTTPFANPPAYVDIGFAADPGQTYKLWVRLKAHNNRGANDSIWLQFTGAVDTNGRPNYRIGTTEGLEINLEECLGCGVSGWGWEDDGWGAVNRNGTVLRFPEGGVQRLRIQVREDGVSVDQIVLSAVRYRTARPGTAKNDNTILPRTQHWPQ